MDSTFCTGGPDYKNYDGGQFSPGPRSCAPYGASASAMMLATLSSALALTMPLRPALTAPLRPSPRCSTAVMAAPGQLLSGCVLPRVSDGEKVDLGELLSAPVTTLVIFGTYPADFNMIEYAQKMRHYWPQLKAKGVESGLIVVNGSPESCKRLAEILDLPAEVELLSDEAGEAGRLFGVSTGWLPDSGLRLHIEPACADARPGSAGLSTHPYPDRLRPQPVPEAARHAGGPRRLGHAAVGHHGLPRQPVGNERMDRVVSRAG